MTEAFKRGFLSKCAEIQKKAYGMYEDYEWTDYAPVDTYTYDTDSPTVLKRKLKKRLKELSLLSGKPLYPGAGVDDRLADEISLSKYRYHGDPDSFDRNEISLPDYERLVNSAIASNDVDKLRDAAEYWSMSARSFLDPYRKPGRTKGFDPTAALILGGLLGGVGGMGNPFMTLKRTTWSHQATPCPLLSGSGLSAVLQLLPL